MARPRAIFMYHEKSSHTPHTLQAIRQREQSVSVLFQSSLSESISDFRQSTEIVLGVQLCDVCNRMYIVVAYGASKAQGHFLCMTQPNSPRPQRVIPLTQSL